MTAEPEALAEEQDVGLVEPEISASETAAAGGRRHLLSISDLGADGIEEVLRVSDAFVEVGKRSIPKVPALRGKTVVTLFVEESTRTKLSFETAAKRLSADVMSFSASSSSLKKGESLRDTVETVAAMGVDAFVIRHSSAGAPAAVSRWVDASVLNAGDGWHEHPTQALLTATRSARSLQSARAWPQGKRAWGASRGFGSQSWGTSDTAGSRGRTFWRLLHSGPK